MDSTSRWLGHVPSVLAGVYAYSVILSVSYQIGRLLPIDHRLILLFSIQDLVANSLVWLPLAAALVIIVFLVDYAVELSGLRNWTAALVGNRSWVNVGLGLFSLAVLSFLILSTDDGLVVFLMFFCSAAWVLLIAFIGSRQGFGVDFGPTARYALIFAPTLAFVSFGLGLLIGLDDLRSPTFAYVVTLEGDIKREISLIANMSSGLIYLERGSPTVRVTNWTQIEELSRAFVPPPRQSILCHHLGIRCRE